MRGLWLLQRQLHALDLTRVQLAADLGGHQPALTVMSPGHRRCRAHALGNGRCGLQRHQQGLRRTGRYGNTAEELLAIERFDAHQQSQVPGHGILQTQTHGALLRPVPTALRRRQAQRGLRSGIERDAPENLPLTVGLGLQIGQHGIFQGDLHAIERPHEVEQHRLRRRSQTGRAQQNHEQGGREPIAVLHNACCHSQSLKKHLFDFCSFAQKPEQNPDP